MSDIKPYLLIEFMMTGGKKVKKQIDIVPSSWVYYEYNKDCMCRFMPGPYTKDSLETLHNLVRTPQKAPADWPAYPVQIRAHADNYPQALIRLERLTHEPYAFTTDTENAPQTRADEILQALKARNSSEGFLEEVLDVRNIPKSASEKRNSHTLKQKISFVSSSDSSESDSNEKKEFKKAKKQKIQKRSSETDPRIRKMKTKKADKPKLTKKSNTASIDNRFIKAFVSGAPPEINDNNATIELPIFPTNYQVEEQSENLLYPEVFEVQGDSYAYESTCSNEILHTFQPNESSANLPNPLEIKDLETTSALTALSSNSKKVLQNNTLAINQNYPFTVYPGKESSNLLIKVDYKLTELTNEIKSLQKNVNLMKIKQDSMLKFITEVLPLKGDYSSKTLTTHDFCEKHKIKLVINNKEKFEQFEQKLKSNKTVYEDFKTIIFVSDKFDSISKCITHILKKFFSRDFAMQCNMTLDKYNKYVLGETTFAKTIIEVLSDYYKKHPPNNLHTVRASDIESLFGTSLSNSKDWDGYRAQRVKSTEKN